MIIKLNNIFIVQVLIIYLEEITTTSSYYTYGTPFYFLIAYKKIFFNVKVSKNNYNYLKKKSYFYE
jgi:hypothetical protein